MLDDKLVASTGDPDEYSEGSSNPDDDWDGVDAVDEDGSKVVLPMNNSIEPGSASFFGHHKEYMQWCLTILIGLTTAQGIKILETQGIDFDALMLLTDSNVKTLFDDKGLKGVPLIKRMWFVALRNWAYCTLHASPDLLIKPRWPQSWQG